MKDPKTNIQAHISYRLNEYAEQFGKDYADTPKAVFAAIAFSFALRFMGDDFEGARDEFRREWETLHANGIVCQKPIRRKNEDF